MKEENDLDLHLLEPGDLLLVANPTDAWLVRRVLFWSHVGIVTEDGVVDAVRDPRGEYIQEQQWGTVQCVPLLVYRANHDIIALRVKCAPEKRTAAARYAAQKVGLPYSPTLRQVLCSRADTSHYSCASLVWQAYETQGIDLDPMPWSSSLLMLPGLLLRSRNVDVMAQGTRYTPIARNWRNIRPIAERLWFKHALRAKLNTMIR